MQKLHKKIVSATAILLMSCAMGAHNAAYASKKPTFIAAHYSPVVAPQLGIAPIQVHVYFCSVPASIGACTNANALVNKSFKLKMGTYTIGTYVTESHGYSLIDTTVPFNPATHMGPTIEVIFAGDNSNFPTTQTIPPQKALQIP